MTKSLVFAFLAVAGTMIFVDDVQARCCRRNRCCGCQTNSCATSCGGSFCGGSACGTCGGTIAAPVQPAPAAQPAPPATTANGRPTVVANNGSTYQSFSFEPGTTNTAAVATAPVMVTRAPMTRRSTNVEYDTVLRGDKKVRAAQGRAFSSN